MDRNWVHAPEVTAAYLAGMSLLEVAAACGLGQRRVWAIVKRAGITRRSGPRSKALVARA